MSAKSFFSNEMLHWLSKHESSPERWQQTLMGHKWKSFSENTHEIKAKDRRGTKASESLVGLAEIIICICSVAESAKCHKMRVIFYLFGINNAKAEKESISPLSISVMAYKVRAVFLQYQLWTVKFFLHLLLIFPLQIKSPLASVPALPRATQLLQLFIPSNDSLHSSERWRQSPNASTQVSTLLWKPSAPQEHSVYCHH